MTHANRPIPSLIQYAFKLAKEGDIHGAMKYWEKAIAAGYTPKPKTERNLRWIIERWQEKRETP